MPKTAEAVIFLILAVLSAILADFVFGRQETLDSRGLVIGNYALTITLATCSLGCAIGMIFSIITAFRERGS